MQENTFTVEVPAGVEEGSTLRLADRGAAGQRGGPNGSLFVHLVINPDPRFERQADNLHTTLAISVAQAALGTETEVETLDGKQRLTIGPGARSTGTSSGSEVSACLTYAVVAEATSTSTSRWRRPRDLSPEQEELLRQFAASRWRDGRRPWNGGRRRRRVLALRSAFG